MAAFLALVEASTLFQESTGGGKFFLVRYLIASRTSCWKDLVVACTFFAPHNVEVILFLILPGIIRTKPSGPLIEIISPSNGLRDFL